ncbi:MAG TPA: hypothetical protein VLR89_10660 [Anaerolineaceae bacterium]|nr:hypothetical protein [Anaerolineaceae bacterium]
MPSPKVKHSIQTLWKACQLWWQDWSNLETVSLLAVLLSLTVFLAPIAYFGLLQVTTDLSHGQRSGLAGFWTAFKQHWNPALVWGLVSLGLLGPLGLGFWYFAINPATFSLAGLILCGAGILIIFTISQLTAACFFLQEPQTLSLALKNAWASLLLHPGYLIGCGLIAFVLSLLSVRYYLPLFVGIESLLALFSILQIQRTLGKEPDPLTK